MKSIREAGRRLVPFVIRAEWSRFRRAPAFLLERRSMARKKCACQLPVEIASAASPLHRDCTNYEERLQLGKEHNVKLASSLIDGTLLQPGQVFSYHHAVGRPSRFRGFRVGLELHDGSSSSGMGGGLCQISNLLFLVAIRAGLEIVERHRHALDLFPDHDRSVPFGCGATVFYNSADLRFRNPFECDIQIALRVADGCLVGAIRSSQMLPYRIEIVERDHRYFRDGKTWRRENRIYRRYVPLEGGDPSEEFICHNSGRCLYDPSESAK